MKNYYKIVVFNYLSIGINILNGFILIPMVIKYLGYEELGFFGVLYSIKNILDIGIGWVSAGIIKNLIRYNNLKNSLYTLSKIINLFFAFIIVLFFLIYGFFNKTYFLVSLLFGIGNFLAFILIPYYELWISELKQFKVAYFKFLQQFLFFVFSIILFYFYRKLEYIFLGMIIANIIVFFKVHSQISQEKLDYSWRFIRKIFWKLILKDNNIFFNGVSTILLLQIDILLISCLYGNKSAGIYLVIFKIPNTLIMLGWRLSEPLQAIVAKEIKENKKKIFNYFKKLEKNIFLLALIAGIGYLIFGKFVIELWIGVDKIPKINYMFIIPSIVIVFSVMQRLYLSVNFYTKGLELVTKLQFIEIIFKVIFIIFFFDYFHELAPIVGWLLAFLLTIWFYRKNSLDVLNNK